MTTDSFVVKPLRFPGGSIGELAVNGTMNDLAVSGAKGHAMLVTLILEEGLRRPFSTARFALWLQLLNGQM
jgi:hydrogenase expression/formation protein HypE